MGKNNRFINQMKELAKRKQAENVSKAIYDMTPQYYAATALALHRLYRFGYRRIFKLFEETRAIWEDFEGRGGELAKACEEETGILIVNNEEDADR